MKKNMLYILICIITLMLFFGVAATCNLCGIPVEIGETEDVSNKDEAEDTDEQDDAAVQDSGDNFQGDGNGNGDGDGYVDTEKEAPTITLEVYEGPTYSDDGDICYYRVEAIVTGNPKPTVEFNRDDSNGAWSDDNIERAQVNLSSPGDTFTLTATATNSEGSTPASIVLEWGCGEENNDPDIQGYEYVATLVYDFMEGAPDAYWRTNWGNISFGGELNDSHGFVRYRDDITLEDGQIYSRVLETHPEYVDDGWIQGIFPNDSDKIQIPAGARFTAKVGFIAGLTRTDGADFRIWFAADGSNYYFPSSGFIHCANDGTLDTLDFDLSSIAGKSGQVVLSVKAGTTSTQDWAVWVDPKITN